jgi:hypothetical protein
MYVSYVNTMLFSGGEFAPNEFNFWAHTCMYHFQVSYSVIFLGRTVCVHCLIFKHISQDYNFKKHYNVNQQKDKKIPLQYVIDYTVYYNTVGTKRTACVCVYIYIYIYIYTVCSWYVI